MKKMFLALCALMSAVVFAEDDIDPDMEAFGGYVRKPGSARGKVVFLNAQKRIPADRFAQAFAEIDFSTKAPCEVKNVASVTTASIKEETAALGAQVGVALVDTANDPALFGAPEERWAMVNVAKLAIDNPDPEKLARRTRLELLRAFALAGGCAFVGRGLIALRNDIQAPADLDRIRSESYGVEAINTFKRNLPRLGVRPWIVVSYEEACQEGWAPQPTNKYQKAVWDRVHAAPTKPIKITYDKDKQKPVVK